MVMLIQTIVVGMFFTNCYVVACDRTKEAIIIDPGFANDLEAKRSFEFIEKNGLKLRFIVNTHGHPDHTCGNGTVKDRYHVPILVHECDAHMLGESGRKTAAYFGFENSSPEADTLLHEEDLVKFGCLNLRVIHTPGHSRGSISLLGENECFTGDTLFEGSIGRTDFPESSEEDMMLSLRKLMSLVDNLVIYTGHGPRTTIADEKRNNPFLRL
jgi:glyoxylase-like metal-dependent hydrolase (beta-lactamase superfamily II)